MFLTSRGEGAQRHLQPAPPPVPLTAGGGLATFVKETPPMEPLLITLEEAGRLIGHTRKQMFELCRERSQSRRKVRLPVVKIGKRCFVRKEALQQWIAAL